MESSYETRQKFKKRSKSSKNDQKFKTHIKDEN